MFALGKDRYRIEYTSHFFICVYNYIIKKLGKGTILPFLPNYSKISTQYGKRLLNSLGLSYPSVHRFRIFILKFVSKQRTGPAIPSRTILNLTHESLILKFGKYYYIKQGWQHPLVAKPKNIMDYGPIDIISFKTDPHSLW